jgi:hypothetical protein
MTNKTKSVYLHVYKNQTREITNLLKAFKSISIRNYKYHHRHIKAKEQKVNTPNSRDI